MSKLNRLDVRLLIGLTAVAFLLRLFSPIFPDFLSNPTAWPPVRAWGIGHPFQAPNGYIFDEVYFAQDACKDLVGMDYYDPEPPLAKLLIAGGMVVGGTWMHYDQGYRHETGVDTNGQATDNACMADGTLPGFGTWGWRLTSLFFGTLVVPLMYLLALRLWPSRFFAFAAASLVLLDGMFFVQSRIAMIDIIAEFLLLLVYWLFFIHRDAKTERAWWRSLLLLGVGVGLALAAKWTTMAALGTITLFLVGGWAVRVYRQRRLVAARRLPEEKRFTPESGETWGSFLNRAGMTHGEGEGPTEGDKYEYQLWGADVPKGKGFFDAKVPKKAEVVATRRPLPDGPPPRVGPQDWLARPIFYVLVLVALPVLIYGVSWFRYNSIPQCSSDSGGTEVPAICASGTPAPPTALRLTAVNAGPVRVWVPSGLDLSRYIHQIWVHDRWAYDYHAHLTATHPYGSKWFSWPLLLRPVAYYYQDGLGTAAVCQPTTAPVTGQPAPPNCTLRAEVFNLGNPAIWWFSIPCVLYCVYVAINERNWRAALIVIALGAAWLPFSRVTRVMFLYHMFGGLPFMMLAIAFTLNRMRRWVLRFNAGSLALPRLNGTHLAGAYLGLVLVTFIYFYPVWSALPISGDSWNQRIWFQLPNPVDIPVIGNDTRISWI